ncbi:hypothetical protein HOY82DRAFT_597656 [Tuber indicum]|nr:hypothetical protein HOY82DRAFT_597656 [Tuber indicum]
MASVSREDLLKGCRPGPTVVHQMASSRVYLLGTVIMRRADPSPAGAGHYVQGQKPGTARPPILDPRSLTTAGLVPAEGRTIWTLRFTVSMDDARNKHWSPTLSNRPTNPLLSYRHSYNYLGLVVEGVNAACAPWEASRRILVPDPADGSEAILKTLLMSYGYPVRRRTNPDILAFGQSSRKAVQDISADEKSKFRAVDEYTTRTWVVDDRVRACRQRQPHHRQESEQ